MDIKKFETAKAGYANGISLQLSKAIEERGETAKLTSDEKQQIIKKAAEKYGQFLDELGVDWRNDPNSSNTPIRVAKAYVNDLWKGRYERVGEITAFPADGYDGIVQESGIPIESMCSHHHQRISGLVSVAYVPKPLEGSVIGLSKLNRIVEHFGRRGQIQEQLTVAIHTAVAAAIGPNEGVAVMVNATHSCVSCRGVKHQGAAMQTAKLSGCFLEEDSARAEFYKNIELSLKR